MKDALTLGVELVEVVERLAAAGDHEARVAVGVLDVADVAGLVEQAQGVVHGRHGKVVG